MSLFFSTVLRLLGCVVWGIGAAGKAIAWGCEIFVPGAAVGGGILAAVGWEGSCGESARQAATLRALRCPGSGLLGMLRKCSRSDIFLVPTRSWCRRHFPTRDGMVADRYQSECDNGKCSPCCAAALPSRTISACQHLAQDLNFTLQDVRTASGVA